MSILGNPILLSGGGSGIPCTLTITTSPDATVIATLGNNIVSSTANSNGVAVLILEKEGTWTVEATDGVATNSIQVSTVYSLSGNIGLVGTLEETGWDTISKMAKAGLASQFWSVGDTKSFTIDGTTYYAQIIGFDHDDVVDSATYGRSKAGITLQMQNCYNETYEYHSYAMAWNNVNMRNYTLPSLLGNVNSDLQDVIVSVNKAYAPTYNGTSLSYSEDTLFLLSEYEVFGNNYNVTKVAEGSQYSYYASGNSKAKTINGTEDTWWLRSRAQSDYIAVVSPSNNSNSISSHPTNTEGVAFAFCV